MSLNWRVKDIKDYETLCWTEDGQLNPITETLILSSMGLGMSGITTKNLTEFQLRMAYYQKINGPILRQLVKVTPDEFDPATEVTERWEPRLLSDEDIENHVGLWTNVTQMTRAAWLKHMFETFVRDYRWYKMRDAEQVNAIEELLEPVGKEI